MSKYFPLLEKYGQEIYALRKRENFETALRGMDVFTQPHNRVPFSLQMGFVVPYLYMYPELMDELRKINEGPINKFYKDRLDYIISPEKAEELVSRTFQMTRNSSSGKDARTSRSNKPIQARNAMSSQRLTKVWT